MTLYGTRDGRIVTTVMDRSPVHGGRCTFDHARGSDLMGVDVLAVPLAPIESCQLILDTEIGVIPKCGIDTERALASANALGRRYVKNRIARSYSIVKGDDYASGRYDRQQLVLSGALAEAEGRFCVADWVKGRLAEMGSGE